MSGIIGDAPSRSLSGKFETIETAAVRVGGVVFTLPRPNRHHNILWWLSVLGVRPHHTHDQGFVLSNGFYVDRETAALIAMASGQVERLIAAPNLYSEDLWDGGADLPSVKAIRALAGGALPDGAGTASTPGDSGMNQ